MSVSTIPCDVITETLECTLGDSTYGGYYYGEIAYHFRSANIIGIAVIGATSNLPVFAIVVGSNIRCYGVRAGMTCTVQISYYRN